MIVKSFAIKFLIFVLPSLLILSCTDTRNPPPKIESESESTGAAILITPTPFTGQQAKIQGENPPIDFAENLQVSVTEQKLPKVWLEFEQENGEIVRFELADNFNKNLNSAGEALYHYQYIINNSDNSDERYNASFNQLTIFGATRNSLSKLEVESPNGKRKLTEEEILEVLYKQSGLINDRYFELDDHFNPKSYLYNFKKYLSQKFSD